MNPTDGEAMPHDAPAAAAPSAPGARAPSLALTGVLMVGASFLLANPHAGTLDRGWPWDVLLGDQHALVVRVTLALWLATALWVLVLAYTPAHATRSTGALGLGAALLAACTTRLTAFEIRTWSLAEMLLLIGVGAGLLVGRAPRARAFGRLLAGLSAIAMAWLIVAPASSAVHGLPHIEAYADGMASFFEAFDLAQADPFWRVLLPQSLVLLACGVGLLGLLGLAGPLLMGVAFMALLIAHLVPLIVGGALELGDGRGTGHLAEELVDTFLTRGFLVWLLGVFAIYDALRERMRAA